MEIAKVAKLMEYLDIALGIILASFVVIVVCVKKLRGNVLFFAFYVAVLSAFVLEGTAFNYPFYLRYFAGPQVGIKGMSDTNSNVITLTNGNHAEFLESGGVRFGNLNMNITSLFVDVDYNNIETTKILVNYTKAGGVTREYAKRFYRYMPRENYVPLAIRGKVSEFTISFQPVVIDSTSSFDVKNIVINKPIPFYFNGLRVFIISLLFFMLFSCVSKRLRASYWPV